MAEFNACVLSIIRALRKRRQVMSGQKLMLLVLASCVFVPSGFPGSLHDAAKNDNYAELRRLILENGDIDARDDANRTPLSWAAEKGSLKTVILPIDAGADVNSRDLTNIRPLGHAVLSGQAKVAEILIENGAEVEVTDITGITLLDDAARLGYWEIANLLRANGAQCGTNLHFSC